LLKDKVAADWHDVAVDKLASRVQFTDEQPELLVNDLPYSLDDGVAEWLRDPSNKRFLPAPKVARQVQQTSGSSVSVPQAGYGTNNPGSMSIDEAASAVTASLAAEGKTLRGLLGG